MIQVDALTKRFKLYHKPSDRLKELLFRHPYHSDYQALRDISFKVESGETLGIIGRNGAGKSTLLKILSGVLLPDAGTVVNNGKVTGLLELGTGFDPAMSGLRNIRTNGLLIGMSETEIDTRTPDIIEFAELGSFINEPLRTYSSGMAMRLAFSIAIHADPKTFLIDEALSVGDGHFQQKCFRKIRDFRERGGAIVFVSHDLNAIKVICDRVIVLDDGRIEAQDTPENAVNHYNQLLAGDAETYQSAPEGGYGNFHVAITDVSAHGEVSRNATVASGEKLLLDVEIESREVKQNLTLGILIRDRFGQDIFGTNSHLLGLSLAMARGEIRVLRFATPMNLAPGKYTVTLALHDGTDHLGHCYHWWDNATQFEVAGFRGAHFSGLCNLQPTLEQRDTCKE